MATAGAAAPGTTVAVGAVAVAVAVAMVVATAAAVAVAVASSLAVTALVGRCRRACKSCGTAAALRRCCTGRSRRPHDNACVPTNRRKPTATLTAMAPPMLPPPTLPSATLLAVAPAEAAVAMGATTHAEQMELTGAKWRPAAVVATAAVAAVVAAVVAVAGTVMMAEPQRTHARWSMQDPAPWLILLAVRSSNERQRSRTETS